MRFESRTFTSADSLGEIIDASARVAWVIKVESRLTEEGICVGYGIRWVVEANAKADFRAAGPPRPLRLESTSSRLRYSRRSLLG